MDPTQNEMSVKDMAARRPKQFPPSGMEDFDLGALSDKQQIDLTNFKIKQRLEDEDYLRTHPEMEILVKCFMRELLLKRPENVREFGADFFRHTDLPKVIAEEAMREERKGSNRRFGIIENLLKSWPRK